MIRFNKALFKITTMKISTVSSALGGSFKFRSEEDAAEQRMPLPFPVARKIVHRFGTHYLQPIEFFVVWYGDDVVSIDTHHVLDRNNTGPIADTNFISLIRSQVAEIRDEDEWWFDGRFIYRPDASVADQPLTADGSLVSRTVMSIDLQGVPGGATLSSTPDEEETDDMSGTRQIIVGIDLATGKEFPSPPIWQNVHTLRGSNDESENALTVDRISRTFHLNLNFVLGVAEAIGYNFGYKHIAPLQIPRLMIATRSVNLAKLGKYQRNRIDCGIPIQFAVLYLLGYLNKTTDLKVYDQLKKCLKHTLGRWMISNEARSNSAYIGELCTGIPLLDPETAREVRNKYVSSDI